MTGDERELSRELTRVVRETPGVQDVYTTGGVVAAALSVVGGAADDDARVSVSRDTVSASIAVAAGFSAPQTLREVSRAIAGYLVSAGHGPLGISVTASRIE